MSKIVEKIRLLQGLSYMGRSTIEDMIEAEKKLGVIFAEEYREYLLEFGCVSYYGHNLTGLSPYTGNSVIIVTQEERIVNPHVPPSMYVIEQAHIDGIVVWQDKDGVIYQSSPSTKYVKLCSSLLEYINL